MSVYLYLFHGRATPDEDVEDWGCEGPAIGPLDYVHTTYGSEVKIRGAIGHVVACSAWSIAVKVMFTPYPP